jgi:hypothetical protein
MHTCSRPDCHQRPIHKVAACSSSYTRQQSLASHRQATLEHIRCWIQCHYQHYSSKHVSHCKHELNIAKLSTTMHLYQAVRCLMHCMNACIVNRT